MGGVDFGEPSAAVRHPSNERLLLIVRLWKKYGKHLFLYSNLGGAFWDEVQIGKWRFGKDKNVSKCRSVIDFKVFKLDQ